MNLFLTKEELEKTDSLSEAEKCLIEAVIKSFIPGLSPQEADIVRSHLASDPVVFWLGVSPKQLHEKVVDFLDGLEVGVKLMLGWIEKFELVEMPFDEDEAFDYYIVMAKDVDMFKQSYGLR